MALAPFFPRVSSAVGSVTGIRGDELATLLGERVVRVFISAEARDVLGTRSGALLLVDLLARLYPVLEMAAPESILSDIERRALAVNPSVELRTPSSVNACSLTFGSTRSQPTDISIVPSGWLIHVDEAPDSQTEPNVFAGLAAGSVAAAEVFRAVFRRELGQRGRGGHQPGRMDLVDRANSTAATPRLDVELPRLHLAGAGAVGQACLHALATAGCKAEVVVVDPEFIELSNIQRYVLSTIEDVGRAKVEVAREATRDSALDVIAVQTHWGADERSGPEQESVLVALDTARDRIGVAAGLHGRVYNAWTQPDDVGWSRHESFGVDPCLACLYWPQGQRLNDDEQVAAALHQHRLRVLSYFVTRTPVGTALPVIGEAADLPPPREAQEWLERPLLVDLIEQGFIDETEAGEWVSKSIGDLYSEGICGGGIVRTTLTGTDEDRIVPLAHQSALAGVMLALQTVLATPALASMRSKSIEQRFDVLTGLPPVMDRPRQRTPACICSDPDYLEVASGRPGRLTH
ncbi:MAG TPA: ThiF family adenylyltransferase [Acidimicrobiales bacterium]